MSLHATAHSALRRGIKRGLDRVAQARKTSARVIVIVARKPGN